MIMPPKRKKNLKIDSSEKFEVLDVTDLDINFLEEFTLPPIDSGMEAEEEKEEHLKQVIEHKSGDIPVPVIQEVDGYAKKKINISSKYYKYHKDADIPYIFSDTDDKLKKDLGISDEEYNLILRHIKEEVDGNQRILKENNSSLYKYVREGIKYKLLLRVECKECPSYVCFRRRILKPSRKNRRSELQTSEKIGRLTNEMVILMQMGELNKENSLLDDEICKLDYEISVLINEILSEHGNVKNKIKNTVSIREKSKRNSPAMQGDIFHNVLFNRESIRILKRRLLSKKNYNEEDYEKEWVAYQQYLKDNQK
ncbi:hypothetical protein P3W45_001265 [Vairimorpha bombi]|jgi:hypothetical protein